MTVNKNGHPRRLQVFSLDPSADVQMETSLVSRSVLSIRWERDLLAGPIGEYLEVIDIDPASNCVYEPVNLNDHLATDGLAPSTGHPQFHQQMVYAVAMSTIRNFENVLGRKVIWSERAWDPLRGKNQWRFVPRLRIYPHALREQNAYYSPVKKALLFGYFNAPTSDPRNELPGGLVFTCLSHDIIAHETAHAILDGIHPRLLEASNADMLAFHEAFADIVAIFQHFMVPGLLLDQIQRTRGDLHRNNLLAKLASQFARSTDRGDALRNALGEFDELGNREEPDPTLFDRTTEPHARGAIVVAAVFDAFLRIHENRVVDLRRIASNGTGILPDGDIHPDLANRFAAEAVKAANRVLTICIRAIDYLPPVDVTFGDYLRALITADAEVVPEDTYRYRLAFVEAFRDRGIYPLDVRSLSEETLRWSPPDEGDADRLRSFLPSATILRTMAYAYNASPKAVRKPANQKDEILGELKENGFVAGAKRLLEAAWCMSEKDDDATVAPEQDAENHHKLKLLFAEFLRHWIKRKARNISDEDAECVERCLGLDVGNLREEKGRIEVHTVRPTIRKRPDRRPSSELVVEITQRVSKPLLDENGGEMQADDGTPLEYEYWGGCTLIIDPEDGDVDYAISKCLKSGRRDGRQAAFLRDQVASEEHDAIVRFGLTEQTASERSQQEPLAIVHRGHQDVGGY